jgi:hypothetical protein
MIENLKQIYQQETPAERSQRMIPAAAYGALIATAYVWALALVNVFTFPELPLGVDWLRVLGMWIGLSTGFAFFGAVAAWFTEEYAGIVGGGLIFTALLAIWFLLTARVQNSTITAQSIITTLPLAGVNMLGAWALRWAAKRYLAIKQEKDPGQQRRQLIKHSALILLMGLVPGLFGRMDTPAQRTLGQLHELLQAAPNDPSVWPRLPLRQVPALQDHFGVDYVFYARPSAAAVSTLDVTVKFDDGYLMTCQLPVSTSVSFITDCKEGK